MTIKLITFDLDNTLWHTDPVIIRAEEAQWQSIIQLCPNAISLFTPALLKNLKLETIEKNPHLRHKLSALRQTFLIQLFIQCGISKQQAEHFSQQVFCDFLAVRNQVELFPGALNLLTALQKRYHVIALTNGNADLKKIGLDHLFNAHFHAENVKRPKPHNDMFLAALKHAKVSSDESLHIGDHPEQDIDAANRMGFKTVWANLLGQTWPKNVNRADYNITHLDQLIDLLL